jgi:predicted helicase
LYDSYIRAIRWASDRIKNRGVIGFVTNAGWLDANTADGLRLCLAEEFSDIYVFHLRGNQRTSGEQSRREGGKVFGSGSRAPIAITLLVKNPDSHDHGRIFFHDIGDYLSREDKLAIVTHFGSIAGIGKEQAWQAVTPDAHGDWLRQRDDSFGEFIALGDKKGGGVSLFDNYSQGVVTSRDAWCYNASKESVETNMRGMIAFYNAEVARFDKAFGTADRKTRATHVDAFVSGDSTKISWSVNLKQDVVRGRTYTLDSDAVVRSVYRPFTKQWMYFDRHFNERVLQMPRIFPNLAAENRVICLTGLGETASFSALIASSVPNFHFVSGSQCFPLYLYDETANADDAPAPGLFDQPNGKADAPPRRDAITNEGLAHFQSAYPGEKLSKEDLFYYVYGLLHSPDYRERYADNLAKELPRVPRVKTAADFWEFSNAGRALADLHLGDETVPMYTGAKVTGPKGEAIDLAGRDRHDAAFWRVEKMKVPKTGGTKDLTTLIYNGKLTVTGIPPEAYEYVVNGKPALDWVIERQCVKKDKDSGIVNDANAWATETMHNPRYPLELFLRIITVSLETMKIVHALPKLGIHTDG